MIRKYLPVLLVFLGYSIASTLTADWSPWVEAILGILAALSVFLERDFLQKETWRSPLTWIAALIIALALVIPWSGDRYASLHTVLYWLVGVSFFFAVRSLDRRWRSKLLLLFTSLTGAGAVWAIVDFIFFSKPDRATGLLNNANGLGGYVALCVPLAISGVVAFRGWKRWLAASASVAILVALVLSASLTAAVALLLTGGVWLFTQPRVTFRRRLGWVGGMLAVVLVLGVGIRFAQMRDVRAAWRLNSAITAAHFQSSFNQRWQFLAVAVDMLRRNPLHGIGPGAYQLSFSQYAESRLEQPRYAHNAYLELAAEGGVGVLVLVLGLAYFLAAAVVRGVREAGAERTLVLGLSMSLLASALHALTDFSWHFPAVWVGFWVLAGLAVSAPAPHPIQVSDRVMRWAVAGVGVFMVVRGLGVAAAFLPLQRAEIALEKEDYPKAIVSYQQGLRWDPDPSKLVKLANALWLSRPNGATSFVEAQGVVDQAIRWAPVNYAAYAAAARLAVAQKDDARAEMLYRRVLSLDRHFHPDLTAEFAVFLRARGRGDEANQLLVVAEQAYANILKPGERLFSSP